MLVHLILQMQKPTKLIDKIVSHLLPQHLGQSIQNGLNKICGRQALKNFTWSILEYFV